MSQVPVELVKLAGVAKPASVAGWDGTVDAKAKQNLAARRALISGVPPGAVWGSRERPSLGGHAPASQQI